MIFASKIANPSPSGGRINIQMRRIECVPQSPVADELTFCHASFTFQSTFPTCSVPLHLAVPDIPLLGCRCVPPSDLIVNVDSNDGEDRWIRLSLCVCTLCLLQPHRSIIHHAALLCKIAIRRITKSLLLLPRKQAAPHKCSKCRSKTRTQATGGCASLRSTRPAGSTLLRSMEYCAICRCCCFVVCECPGGRRASACC